MRFFRCFSTIFILGCIAWYLAASGTNYQSFGGQTMGTWYSVKIRTSKEDKNLPQKISEYLEAFNRKMSVFDPESEISRINRAKAGEWIRLSPEMSAVMKDASRIWKLSGGAFDPTVGKLVGLWGFGAETPQKMPSAAEISEALKETGFDKLEFDDDCTRIKKKKDNIYINLSAIAKGYGVDRLSELLKEEGYTDFVIEIGGEVIARGNRSPKENGWKIGVAKPAQTRENAFVVSLRDKAVATSGDYRNYYYKDGQKYSHTISPRSGYPVKHNLASVTVFGDSSMEADALATAAMVMGEKKALKFANDNNLAFILFVRRGDDSFETLLSEQAKKITGE